MSVAFHHAMLDEDIWVDPPQEEDHGVVWQLKRAVCGTRRAAVLIQEYVIQAMVKIGFTVPANSDVRSRNMAGAGKFVRWRLLGSW